MNIGLLYNKSGEVMDSMKHVFSCTEHVLRRRHELIFRDDGYWTSNSSEKEHVNVALLQKCDILLGPVDDVLLSTREKTRSDIPYLVLLLGNTARGLTGLRTCWQQLTTRDILVCNCRGDVDICNTFFENSTTHVLPFAYDDTTFYAWADSARAAAKARLGFSGREQLILYAGRVTLEKNLHTVLKLFSVLNAIDPEIHLVVAGGIYNNPFVEFGIFPVDLSRWLLKVAASLGIDPQKLHLLGWQTPAEVALLYNACDVSVNLTLHHDENFGLSQLESMACGTPVVGSNWGGLKDTIRHGYSGYTADTYVSQSGVKVDWLSAASKIHKILTDGSLKASLRHNCIGYAKTQFSISVYTEAIEAMIVQADRERGMPLQRLAIRKFAQDYWDLCSDKAGPGTVPLYLRSDLGLDLYRQLIRGYAGVCEAAGGSRSEGNEILCLTAAVTETKEEGVIAVDDPIFLLDVQCPTRLRAGTKRVLQILNPIPWRSARELHDSLKSDGNPEPSSTIDWMLDAGLIIRTSCTAEELTYLDLRSNVVNRSYMVRQTVPCISDAVLLR